ncbi:MAG TPA: M4 family metallopeptidase [Pyrinomonadaceae bacterium]|nr:M4 family metallopeptidase [Pyrinomonadaceae bacterium]
MKKILGVLAVIVVALVAFGVVSKRATANKAVFNTGSQDEREMAKQISLDFLRGRAAERAIGNADDFEIKRVEIDGLKTAHTHVRQRIGGVPVWEGEAIVHIAPDGSVKGMTDALADNIAINTTPNFGEKEALSLAIGMYTGKARLTDTPTIGLFIYRGDDRDHLVYRVETPRLDGSRGTSVPVVFVDAHTGERVDGYDNLQTGSGSSLYSGTVAISTSQSGANFYMEDTTRRMGTFNMNNTGNTSTGTGGTQSRYTDVDDNWTATNARAGVDAHYGAAKTFDYYQTVHGRNGIDGNYGPGTTTAAANGVSIVASRVHFGSNYNNAFWYQNMMTYGDGNGTTFTPLTTIDICGHEMTHGVTERTANLTYAKESGALNESWSDIMGSMVELYADGGTVSGDTWKIGEDAYTPGTAGDALRRMDNPNAVGDPDHYTLRLYQGSCTASNANDQCGVHTNSSISNHAFYLIANGGTNRVSGVAVTGIGGTDAAKIFYRALTTYMTASTNFAGARTATLSAATDLFGASSAQYNSVATGWCAVGVGACPGGSTPTPTPTPPTGGTELLTNGGFETSASPWVGSGTGYFYTANGASPHGGTGYIYFGVNNSVTGQSYQQVAIPTTATGTLTFWLNVTSSETTTTTAYDKLFVEVRNTSGTLLTTLATYSNLNKVASASTYSQKSFSLAAYKGQTVRVQFRSTMDSSITSTFRVDDVSLK